MFLLLLVLAGAAGTLPRFASAEDDMPKLGIQPADSDEIFFKESMKPGSSKDLKVELSNTGKSDVSVLTYAADVYSLVNGGLGVKLAGDAISGTTTWLDYPTETMDLPHGEGRVITFSVTVPKDTAPGQYVTSLVIQNAEPVQGTGDLTVNQILRQAIAVSITVPGDLKPALEIGKVTYLDNPLIDSVQIEVRNTGTAHLKPEGNLRILDSSGALALDVQVGMDSVYAGTSTILEIGLTQPFASGAYTATIELTDPSTGATASVQDEAFTVANTEQASTDVRVDALSVDPVRASDTAPVQFANVVVSIENPGAPIENGQVVLHVERDGQLVEDYPLTMGEPIDAGATEIRQRYLPLTG